MSIKMGLKRQPLGYVSRSLLHVSHSFSSCGFLVHAYFPPLPLSLVVYFSLTALIEKRCKHLFIMRACSIHHLDQKSRSYSFLGKQSKTFKVKLKCLMAATGFWSSFGVNVFMIFHCSSSFHNYYLCVQPSSLKNDFSSCLSQFSC